LRMYAPVGIEIQICEGREWCGRLLRKFSQDVAGEIESSEVPETGK
jgi:hypothetical protein